MYCKNCGRQLRGEARFCDRCGQPTGDGAVKNTQTRKTTSSKNTKSIKSTSNTKSRADYERNKKKREDEKRRLQKKRRTVVFLILIAIAAATALGFASYNMTKKELDKEKTQLENTLLPQQTEQALTTEETENSEENEDGPEATAKATQTASAKKTEASDEKEEKDSSYYKAVSEACKIYRDDRMDDVRCPYPSSFEQGSKSNKNTVISLVDPLNDGAMMICAETVGTQESAISLMKDYAEGVGGTIKDSRAGDNWYEISFERNNKFNHRKAVLVDGLCVYYDFTYDVDSSEKDSYEQYIEYIDYYLDEEVKSASENESSKEKR